MLNLEYKDLQDFSSNRLAMRHVATTARGAGKETTNLEEHLSRLAHIMCALSTEPTLELRAHTKTHTHTTPEEK